MDLARYVVDAVVVEGRTYREVARAHGVSKSWVAKLVGRFREGGYEGIGPRSRAARTIPHRTAPEVEDQIVALRKELTEQGLDAGAETIGYHLAQRGGEVPSTSTIWRVLRRRGFVTPQPHKRPRSSFIRFEATLPNERWQSDVTHWKLADGSEAKIVNFVDDHSRLAVGAKAMRAATAPRVLALFQQAGARWGFPAALLTDNGCVYTTWHRGGPNAMQTELLALGVAFRHSRPYHPQTCGKVERFHQTMKRFLAAQPRASSIRELQGQIDRFVAYYNEVRPHPGHRPADPQGRLRVSRPSQAHRTEAGARSGGQGAPGPHRQGRPGDPPPPGPAPPHRGGPGPQGNQGPPADRRAGRADRLRERGAAPSPQPGSSPRLPA